MAAFPHIFFTYLVDNPNSNQVLIIILNFSTFNNNLVILVLISPNSRDTR